MDKPRGHYAKRKKADPEGQISRYHLYRESKIVKLIEIHNDGCWGLGQGKTGNITQRVH